MDTNSFAMVRARSRGGARRLLAALRAILLLVPLSAHLLAAPAAAAAAADDTVAIDILHVNDVYQIGPPASPPGRGGLARLGGLVDAQRARNPATLLTFGGDTLSPSVESSLFGGAQMMRAWNALGVDVAVIGNHEFDFGPEVFEARLAESRFPWLAANVTRGGRLLPHTRAGVVREVAGVRIGFVGVITPETANLSRPGKRIHFGDYLEAARRAAQALRGEGATVLVALTHLDLGQDRRLARTGLFDVILGGHDHHVVIEEEGPTPIYKAGSDARDALHLAIEVGRDDGRRRRSRATLRPVDDHWPEKPEVAAIEREVRAAVAAKLGETVGYSDVALDGRTEAVRSGETNLGDFIVDTLLAYAREAAGAEVALFNGGSFRGDAVLGPGGLTRYDLRQTLPFENPVVVLSIPGATLRRALEHGLDRMQAEGRSGAMPHVGGLRLAYDAARAPGERIVELSIGGAPVDAARAYRLVTSTYLAGGGDGYAMLQGLPVLRTAESSRVDTDILIESVQRAGRIAPAADGRVRILK